MGESGWDAGLQDRRAGQVPPPLPVMPLEYAGPRPTEPMARSRGRGLMYGLGVTSIILGLLGLILNGAGSASWLAAYRNSVPPKPPTPLPLPTFAPHDGDYIGTRGIKADLRQTVEENWDTSKAGQLIPDRRAMLECLLCDAGADIFPGATSPDQVRSMVLDNGRLERDANITGLPKQFLTTRAGRIILTSTSAEFIPTNATTPSVRIHDDVFVDAAGTEHWSAWALNERLDDLRMHCHDGMNAMEASAIIQQVVAIPVKGNKTLPISEIQRYGPTALTIDGQMLYMFPKGWLVTAMSGGQLRNIDPETGTEVFDPTAFRPKFRGDTAAMLALSAEGGASAVLFAILTIIGIIALVRPEMAVRPHLAWVAIKLPMIAFFGIAFWTLISTGMVTTGGSSAPTLSDAESRLVMQIVAASIYPVVLLFLLFGPLRFLTRRADPALHLDDSSHPPAGLPGNPFHLTIGVCGLLVAMGSTALSAQPLGATSRAQQCDDGFHFDEPPKDAAAQEAAVKELLNTLHTEPDPNTIVIVHELAKLGPAGQNAIDSLAMDVNDSIAVIAIENVCGGPRFENGKQLPVQWTPRSWRIATAAVLRPDGRARLNALQLLVSDAKGREVVIDHFESVSVTASTSVCSMIGKSLLGDRFQAIQYSGSGSAADCEPLKRLLRAINRGGKEAGDEMIFEMVASDNLVEHNIAYNYFNEVDLSKDFGRITLRKRKENGYTPGTFPTVKRGGWVVPATSAPPAASASAQTSAASHLIGAAILAAAIGLVAAFLVVRFAGGSPRM